MYNKTIRLVTTSNKLIAITIPEFSGYHCMKKVRKKIKFEYEFGLIIFLAFVFCFILQSWIQDLKIEYSALICTHYWVPLEPGQLSVIPWEILGLNLASSRLYPEKYWRLNLASSRLYPEKYWRLNLASSRLYPEKYWRINP